MPYADAVPASTAKEQQHTRQSGGSPRQGQAAATKTKPKPKPKPRAMSLYIPKLVTGPERLLRPSKLLGEAEIMQLNQVLPSYCRDMHWKLNYDLQTDGVQMSTMYKKCEGNGENLVVVRSHFGDVFGCFATEEWRVQEQHYGTGDCFLFTFMPEEEGGTGGSDGPASESANACGPLRVFKWSGQNHEFMLGRKSQIAMGGGGGHFGLYLGEDFLGCSTGKCRTFGNPPLTRETAFDCLAVEVWSFVPPR